MSPCVGRADVAGDGLSEHRFPAGRVQGRQLGPLHGSHGRRLVLGAVVRVPGHGGERVPRGRRLGRGLRGLLLIVILLFFLPRRPAQDEASGGDSFDV